MKLPFAVYTARDGYAWQSCTEAGTAKLERLRKAIGKMPEFDFGDSASSGVLNAGDEIVLYRFMRQEKADSHGRAALYLAMTFFPRDNARFINADSALSSPPFAQPLKDPPSWFDYQGPPAVPSDFLVPENNGNGSFDQAGSLATAGFVFSKPINGNLHISRKEPNEGKGCLFQYRSPTPATSTPEERQPTRIAALYNEPAVKPRTSKWKWAAILMGGLSLIEAVALCWLAWDRMRSPPPPTPGGPLAPTVEVFTPGHMSDDSLNMDRLSTPQAVLDDPDLPEVKDATAEELKVNASHDDSPANEEPNIPPAAKPAVAEVDPESGAINE